MAKAAEVCIIDLFVLMLLLMLLLLLLLLLQAAPPIGNDVVEVEANAATALSFSSKL